MHTAPHREESLPLGVGPNILNAAVRTVDLADLGMISQCTFQPAPRLGVSRFWRARGRLPPGVGMGRASSGSRDFGASPRPGMEPGYDLWTPLARAETPLNNSDALEELRGRLRERFGPTVVDVDGCRPPNAAAGVRVSIRLIPGRPAHLEESYAGQIDDVVNPVIRVRTRVPLKVLKDEKELQRVLDLVGRRVVTMNSSHAGAYKGALSVLSHDSDIFELSDDDFDGLRAWAALAFLAASAERGSSLETFFEVCGHAMRSLARSAILPCRPFAPCPKGLCEVDRRGGDDPEPGCERGPGSDRRDRFGSSGGQIGRLQCTLMPLREREDQEKSDQANQRTQAALQQVCPPFLRSHCWTPSPPGCSSIAARKVVSYSVRQLSRATASATSGQRDTGSTTHKPRSCGGRSLAWRAARMTGRAVGG